MLFETTFLFAICYSPRLCRDDTEPEMQLYIAGIVRPFGDSFSSRVRRHLELAKWGRALSLKAGIFSSSNWLLRAKFIKLRRMAVLQSTDTE